MQIQFEILDGSDELEELQEILIGEGVDVNANEYCENLVLGWLSNRVKNEYVSYATKQNTEILKEKFGSLSDVRTKNKEII